MRFPNDLRPTRRHARAAARPSQRRKPGPRAGEMRTALTGWGGANAPRAGNARTGLSRAAPNAATRPGGGAPIATPENRAPRGRNANRFDGMGRRESTPVRGQRANDQAWQPARTPRARTKRRAVRRSPAISSNAPPRGRSVAPPSTRLYGQPQVHAPRVDEACSIRHIGQYLGRTHPAWAKRDGDAFRENFSRNSHAPCADEA